MNKSTIDSGDILAEVFCYNNISIQGKLDYEKLSNLWNRLPLIDRTNICVNIDYVINMLKEV